MSLSLSLSLSLRSSARPAAAVAVAALSLTLAACGSDDAGAASSSEAGSEVTVADAWVKAAPSGMTAVFGTLTNDGGDDARLVAADTGVSTSMELHEMAVGDGGAMVMRELPDGIEVPADGTHELSPGGDHLMLMDLTDPVRPGDTISVTLTFDDGSTTSFDAPARSFSGADEDYDGR